MSLKHIIHEIRTHFAGRSVVCAELGIFKGESIPIFLENLNIQEYHGCDLFEDYEELDGAREFMRVHGNAEHLRLQNMYRNDSRVTIHKGLTVEVVRKFPDNYFDLIFIDANHEYPFIKQDLQDWFPKMKKEGIFSGDDFFYPPVAKAVKEFSEQHKLKVFNSSGINPDPRYLSPWSWYVKI